MALARAIVAKAREEFAKQQEELRTRSAAASSAAGEEGAAGEDAAAAADGGRLQLAAPISPSPPELIEQGVRAALEMIAGEAVEGGGKEEEEESARERERERARALRVVDLGCGDGRWLRAFARMAPQEDDVHCWGCDVNTDSLQTGRALAEDDGVAHRVVLEQADLFSADISTATIVVLYLFPEACAQMQLKLDREARRNTVVLSVGFRIPGWTPLRKIEYRKLVCYMYRVS